MWCEMVYANPASISFSWGRSWYMTTTPVKWRGDSRVWLKPIAGSIPDQAAFSTVVQWHAPQASSNRKIADSNPTIGTVTLPGEGRWHSSKGPYGPMGLCNPPQKRYMELLIQRECSTSIRPQWVSRGAMIRAILAGSVRTRATMKELPKL